MASQRIVVTTDLYTFGSPGIWGHIFFVIFIENGSSSVEKELGRQWNKSLLLYYTMGGGAEGIISLLPYRRKGPIHTNDKGPFFTWLSWQNFIPYLFFLPKAQHINPASIFHPQQTKKDAARPKLFARLFPPLDFTPKVKQRLQVSVIQTSY